jgi:hypothetical protein
MPTGTFEYRDEAERAAIEHAVAFVAQMRDLAVAAADGQVLDRLEGHALDAGRELLRGTLERAVQADVDDAEGKAGRIAGARAGAVGVASDGPSGTWRRPSGRSAWAAGIAAVRRAGKSASRPTGGWGWTGSSPAGRGGWPAWPG